MKVKELIKALKQVDQDSTVLICGEEKFNIYKTGRNTTLLDTEDEDYFNTGGPVIVTPIVLKDVEWWGMKVK